MCPTHDNRPSAHTNRHKQKLTDTNRQLGRLAAAHPKFWPTDHPFPTDSGPRNSRCSNARLQADSREKHKLSKMQRLDALMCQQRADFPEICVCPGFSTISCALAAHGALIRRFFGNLHFSARLQAFGEQRKFRATKNFGPRIKRGEGARGPETIRDFRCRAPLDYNKDYGADGNVRKYQTGLTS